MLGVGTVGMLAMQIAKAGGAQVFAIDTRQMSLDLAGDLGADETIWADDPHVDNTLRELTNGDGPDVIIDAAGAASAPADAFQSVGPGGRVVLVAMIYTDRPQFDFTSVVGAEKEIVGSISYVQRDVETVVRLLSDGTLRTAPLISDMIGLDEVISVGFKRMLEPTKDIFRILVSPSGEK